MAQQTLLVESPDLQATELKRVYFAMESVCILTAELLNIYKEDNTVIQSFLTKMSDKDMSALKSEIDKFIAHLSEVETGLALDRQEL